MEQIVCKKCHIPYRKRSICAHEAICMGGIDGFTPIREKNRFVFRCQTCGLTVRKQGTVNHQKRCIILEEVKKDSK